VRFFHVTDPNQIKTTNTLRRACKERGVEYLDVIPGAWTWEIQPLPGDALYRSSPLGPAFRMERALAVEGMATFYPTVEEVHVGARANYSAFKFAGLPVPKAIVVVGSDPDGLRRAAAELGGFPLVVKVPGWSTGIGVIRVESPASLQPLVKYLISRRSAPMLMEYIDLVAAHRLTVIGDGVYAPYTKAPSPDDFRTNTAGATDEGTFEATPEMVELCLAAARVRRLEFGGVDLLEDRDGRLYITEMNFPSFFPRQEEVTGVHIGGLMLDYLMKKAARLTAEL
jgi:hypothetical protein